MKCLVCGDKWDDIGDPPLCWVCRRITWYPRIRQARNYGRAMGWTAYDIIENHGLYKAVERKGARVIDTERIPGKGAQD